MVYNRLGTYLLSLYQDIYKLELCCKLALLPLLATSEYAGRQAARATAVLP